MAGLRWLWVASLGVDHLNGMEANASSSIEIRDLFINEESSVHVQPSEGVMEYLGIGFGAANLKGEDDLVDRITETQPVYNGFGRAGAVAHNGSLRPVLPERFESSQSITKRAQRETRGMRPGRQ